ncbi:MAG: hypothetical protein COB36_12785 [Alphaproteobacteria bacterium]|nr:MAG: hypothetical protein COB36_12785 [Alphaproteobacteria bacterium]
MRKFLKYTSYAFLGLVSLLIVAYVGLGLSVKLPGEYTTPSGMMRYTSQHLTMRDGIEIAVDVWLPEDYTDEELPTLIHATRYGRAFNTRFPYRVLIALGRARPVNYGSKVRTFNENGYVMVKIDARGSGASFGERPYDLSNDELEDYGEVIDWIVQQSWSNGRVGALGTSYPGMTAEMMTKSNRPALRAIAPHFTYYDVYQNLSHPGGVFDKYFIQDWSDLTQAMDENKCFIYGSDFECWMFMRTVGGIRPVNGRDANAKYKKAYRNRNNPSVMENLKGFKYRDDISSRGNKIVSPYLNAAETESSGVAMHVQVGWHDSANVDGAIARFKTLKNRQQLIIGAFSHGGSRDTNPFVDPDTPVTPKKSEQRRSMLAFFDPLLKGDKSSSDSLHQIQYYTLGENEYHTTNVWPPKGIATQRWSFADGGTLNADVVILSDEKMLPEGKTFDEYNVDFTATTGKTSRWHSIGGPDIVYPDRHNEDAKLLTYTSGVLEGDLEITGAPQVTVNLASTHENAALHIYLEAVAPDGRVTYITEGILALENRALSDTPPYVLDTVYHSLERKDARPMVPGVAENIVVPLYNISVLIPKGYRIRIAIAGADRDTFARVPDEGMPVFTINRSRTHPSFVDLPQRWR